MKFMYSLVVVCAIALAQTSVNGKQVQVNLGLLQCIVDQSYDVLASGSLPKEWEDYRTATMEIIDKAAKTGQVR